MATLGWGHRPHMPGALRLPPAYMGMDETPAYNIACSSLLALNYMLPGAHVVLLCVSCPTGPAAGYSHLPSYSPGPSDDKPGSSLSHNMLHRLTAQHPSATHLGLLLGTRSWVGARMHPCTPDCLRHTLCPSRFCIAMYIRSPPCSCTHLGLL